MYNLKVTESQLRLIADCVEDVTRFLAGQTELQHATSLLENYIPLNEELRKLHDLVVPELRYGASYGWSGGDCPNEHQRKAIAMGYGVYREIVHFLTVNNPNIGSWNVYTSPTLTCPEQGPLPVITEVIEETNK